MTLQNILNRLTKVVLEEAARNPQFKTALNDALGISTSKKQTSDEKSTGAGTSGEIKRGKNRRPPAVLDPVQLVRSGEQVLRSNLEKLTLDQLRDIVAEYGMDPSRLVMKWNTPERVIDRIVEISIARAHKGDAFRKPSDETQSVSLAGSSDASEGKSDKSKG